MATKVGNGLDLQGQRIRHVGTPTSDGDAATKEYVDGLARGITWKESVKAASDTQVDVSNPGLSKIDGVDLSSADRILLLGQTQASENGIWEFRGNSSALQRAEDYDTGTEVPTSAAVSVDQGEEHGGKMFMLTGTTNADPAVVIVDTDGSTWSQLGGGGQSIKAGNGLDLDGATLSVKASDDTIKVSGSGIAVDPEALEFARRHTKTLNPGQQVYTVNHGLGTRVVVQVYDEGLNLVLTDVTNSDADGGTSTVTFGKALDTDYTVVVVG